MTTVYFIRHGESVTNLENRFAGQLDVPLTEKGRAQARLTAAYLQKVPFAAIYSSDLQRAYETARIVADPHSLDVIPVAGLREIHAGKWQGRLVADLPKEFPEEFHLWKTEIGKVTCPGGESMAALQTRAVATLNDIVRRHPQDTVCIVAHGGVIRVLLAYLTGVPMAELHKTPTWVSNASVSIATFNGIEQYRLVQRDQHEHLDALGTETMTAL